MNMQAKLNASDDLLTDGCEKTLDVFDVIVADGRKPAWKRVGLAYLDEAGTETMVIKESEDAPIRVLELRTIDRASQPVREGVDPRRAPVHELLEETRGRETRVGVTFRNRDGSFSLVIDEGERESAKRRFQLREPKRTTRK